MNDIAFFSYAYAIAQFWEILKKFQIFCRMKVFSGKITPIANVRSVEFSEIIKPINSLINSCMQISWDLYQMLFTRNCVHSSQIRIRIRFFLQNICSFTVLVVYKYKWGKLHKFHLNGLESVRKFNAKPSQHGKKKFTNKEKRRVKWNGRRWRSLLDLCNSHYLRSNACCYTICLIAQCTRLI